MLAEQPSVRLLKHIIRCYLRLSDNPRAREALRQCLPDLLRNPQFTNCLKVIALLLSLFHLARELQALYVHECPVLPQESLHPCEVPENKYLGALDFCVGFLDSR